VNYDNSLVVTLTVPCYSWAPSSGDHLFTCGVIHRPPHPWLEPTVFGNELHCLYKCNCIRFICSFSVL